MELLLLVAPILEAFVDVSYERNYEEDKEMKKGSQEIKTYYSLFGLGQHQQG